MTITSPETVDVQALRERAIGLGVEALKCHRAGAHTAAVVQMSYDAILEAQETAGIGAEVAAAVDVRFAAYLLSCQNPRFVQTIAFDGDLAHPENMFGEKVAA
ncbi:hypothetical protein [Streptomyces sp. cg35]|uniref:hypothetical protein n=1 Tax=Streptomyces sp. cg35 TaxID=3421650 RepID=UPI003D184252